ncbi:hypothetical protein GCM10025862_27740 [Arsenicicoccus piscis]|uniref:Uncharacterized protein n=1 Tax=Arsenicicoccus piscis TaxID=673954 RepID=A0ABQ6HSU5_9MICO|nr:hypothetical protein GCM10025862_27740 [Arsenicicoccus piscis]
MAARICMAWCCRVRVHGSSHDRGRLVGGGPSSDRPAGGSAGRPLGVGRGPGVRPGGGRDVDARPDMAGVVGSLSARARTVDMDRGDVPQAFGLVVVMVRVQRVQVVAHGRAALAVRPYVIELQVVMAQAPRGPAAVVQHREVVPHGAAGLVGAHGRVQRDPADGVRHDPTPDPTACERDGPHLGRGQVAPHRSAVQSGRQGRGPEERLQGHGDVQDGHDRTYAVEAVQQLLTHRAGGRHGTVWLGWRRVAG